MVLNTFITDLLLQDCLCVFEGVYALVNSLVEVSKFCVLNEKLTISGVAKNNYLGGGGGCSRDILNIIHKSIEYKIINFHISSYSCTLINMKNYLVQCRNTKKNIHIK